MSVSCWDRGGERMDESADNLGRFVVVVRDYCEVIEKQSDLSQRQFIQRIRELLPQLYLHALYLPDTNSDLSAERAITHEQWSKIFGWLISKLGNCDTYWEVFDPAKDPPDKLVCGSLADDLADIYRDLKDGLLEWDKGHNDIRDAVVWEWKFSFETHWGDHLVDGLRGLNWMLKHRELTD